MRLLAFDTATDACSVALLIDGKLVERHEVVPQGHAERLLDMVDDVLAEAGQALSGLDGLAFGRGPGSFTGLRIAAGAAQGLAYGAGLPVVAVSSLRAVAQGEEGRAAHSLLVAFDARMGEVYWGAFERGADGLARALGEERVSPPESVAEAGSGPWTGLGSGFLAHREGLERALVGRLTGIDAERLPRAADVARLGAAALAAGEAVTALEALPVYLRDRVVRTPRAGPAKR